MNKKSIQILFIILLSTVFTELIAQSVTEFQNPTDLIIGKSFRIYPSQVSQSETFIINHPTNSNIMFASAYTFVPNPFFISEGIYVSTNSGENWYGSDTCSGLPIQFHGGEPAISIDKNGTFLINRLGRQPTFIGLYSHYSTDHGITWSSQLTISTDELEKHSIASDVFSVSDYYGRSYAVYTMLTPPYNVKITYSDNGGQNWIPTYAINNPQIRCFGTDIDVKLNGEVLVCWAVIPTDVASPYEIYIGFAISSNGGSSWIVQEKAIQTRGITGILSQKQNIRVNSTPRIAVDNSNSQYNGNIYIVTSQKELAPAGNDPDIVLFKSIDNGVTWSQGIRVNQDALNNGKIQFFPSIHIDPFGGINILYLDDRNTTSDSTGVFLSRSMDGGETWTDYQVSDHNFQPIAVSGLGAGNVSDHIDITYTNGKLWPVWMDNSTGVYQVWTAPIALDSVSESINAPSNLFAEADTFSIGLSWTDNSANELGFVIERRDGPILGSIQFFTIDTVLTNIINYLDIGLLSNSTYTYRIHAFNQYGVSAFSNSIEATTLPEMADSNDQNLFFLKQNYPNPFTSETTIEVGIAHLSKISLKLYDILGNEIAVLVDDYFSDGQHQINFNSSELNRNLSSGIYFYRLTADNFSETKSMVLIK